MPLWLVEGLPATGKSTLAQVLCDAMVSAGRPARWHLEESRDHPVRQDGWGAALHDGTLAQECLRRWAVFADRLWADPTLHIVEGTAFQSTVRFLLESRAAGISDYYRAFESIAASVSARMVYLRPDDALQHSRYACELRGPVWSAKVAQYLQAQPYSRARGWRGLEGMHRFWADYAQVCDGLAAGATVPTGRLRFVPGRWADLARQALQFLSEAEDG